MMYCTPIQHQDDSDYETTRTMFNLIQTTGRKNWHNNRGNLQKYLNEKCPWLMFVSVEFVGNAAHFQSFVLSLQWNI